MGFSDKQHLKQNVNPPPLMMMPVAADPIIQIANKPISATFQNVSMQSLQARFEAKIAT